MIMHVQPKRALLPLVAALAGLAALPAAAQTTPPASAQAPAPAAQPVKEQAALDMLKQMCDKLAATQAFSVSVRDVRQVATTTGQMIDLVGEFDIQVARPDKVRMEGTIGAIDTIVNYDGSKMVILDKPKNLYVSEDVTGDLQTALNNMEQKHGVEFGVTDFLAKDPYPIFTQGLTNAIVVGDVKLDDVPMKQLAFATPTTEYQLWIDPATSLPKLLSATYLDTQPRPAHFAVEFDDWKLGAPSTDFKFTPPNGASQITFMQTPQ